MVTSKNLAEAVRRAAAEQRCAPAALSLSTIAEAAGISRSTLVRQFGGRLEIDAVLQREGVSRPNLIERLVVAAGLIIASEGMSALSLERAASAADCTVASIYAQVGGRDALLIKVFDRHAVLPQIAPLLDDPSADLARTVAAVYHELIDISLDDSVVTAALMIDALGRPESGLATHLRESYLPDAGRRVGDFLTDQIRRGTIREMSRQNLMAQFFGPIQFYVQTAVFAGFRPGAEDRALAADEFAEAFLRLTKTDSSDPDSSDPDSSDRETAS